MERRLLILHLVDIMVKLQQREGSKVIITPLAQQRIDDTQCPACGLHKEKWTRRTDWTCCSTKCTEEYYKENGYITWAELREEALKRDNYTCVKCGKQPTSIVYHNIFKEVMIDQLLLPQGVRQFLVVDKSALVGDHIIPIAVGGDEWDLSNVQTLCIDCNKKKTRLDLQKIHKERDKKRILRHHYKLKEYGGEKK